MRIEQSSKLAVLIDADNTSAEIIESLLEEIAKYGIASVKRIYGDWSSDSLKKWREVLLPHAIIPIQQFAYTKGKNATDMSMVINAMDLLYSGTFDGFCIISSDSDFTRLASRIRENGLTVYGFGKRQTPEAFRKACDKFIYVENLQLQIEIDNNEIMETNTNEANNLKPNIIRHKKENNSALLNLVYKAVKECADETGWAALGPIGSYIVKVNSDFDPRNYGYSKLSELITELKVFDIKRTQNQFYVRKRSFSVLIKLVQKAIKQTAKNDGWSNFNDIRDTIYKIDPNFNCQLFGFKTDKEAIQSINSTWLGKSQAGSSMQFKIIKEI